MLVSLLMSCESDMCCCCCCCAEEEHKTAERSFLLSSFWNCLDKCGADRVLHFNELVFLSFALDLQSLLWLSLIVAFVTSDAERSEDMFICVLLYDCPCACVILRSFCVWYLFFLFLFFARSMSDLAGLLMAGCCLVLLLVRKLKIRMRYFLAACRSHETVI